MSALKARRWCFEPSFFKELFQLNSYSRKRIISKEKKEVDAKFIFLKGKKIQKVKKRRPSYRPEW